MIPPAGKIGCKIYAGQIRVNVCLYLGSSSEVADSTGQAGGGALHSGQIRKLRLFYSWSLLKYDKVNNNCFVSIQNCFCIIYSLWFWPHFKKKIKKKNLLELEKALILHKIFRPDDVDLDFVWLYALIAKLVDSAGIDLPEKFNFWIFVTKKIHFWYDFSVD